ncbi:MAG: S41 family peptidase [Anaerolineae bacterium]|nr:S41 family peptidase [Anaerolineae bacterium]
MKRWMRVALIIPLVGMIFGFGYVLGTTNPIAWAQGGRPAGTDQLFGPFWEAWNTVHRSYVDPMDDDTLMQGAISGMVAALGDRHSAYMKPQIFNSLTSELNGSFEGIGATVRKDTQTGGLTIVATIAGSPARAAGIRSGDLVVTVNGKDITQLPESDIIDKVRGPAGTPVKLGIIRKGEKQLLEITVTRARIVVPTITTALYENKIGYIRLAEFTETASDDFAKALTDLDANHLDGLILDLRGNPGGGLITSINIASQFLKSGPIVIERFKPGQQDKVYNSTGETLAPDVPLVVLIDGGSASASELVSAALRDRGRAILVGTRSFGKGSVQQWSGLSNGGGLRVTIAHFFSPTNRTINEIGITPDVVVPWDVEANPDVDPQLAEAYLILRGEF